MSEAITEAAPRPVARSRDRALTLLGLAALVAASVGLFIVTRGKWSDAIIDSGREWIVPDALARGDLLYRDVVYWFGPFTPYFHAAFFRIFGSSYATLVAAGVVGSLGVLAALFFGLRSVTERREAALWTSLAVPALVFMPNAGGPILGMGYRIWHAAAFTVAAIALASRRGETRRPILRAAGVGALCALAGLCRTEWGLVAAGASFFAFLRRVRAPRERARAILSAAAAFLLLFGGTIAGFIAVAGWKAVIEDGHVLFTGLPRETRTFLLGFSGLRDWRSGILELVYSAATWGGLLLLLQMLAIGGSDRTRTVRKASKLALVFLVLAATAALGGAGGAVVFSAAPLVCASAAVLAVVRPTRTSAGLLGFGIAGLLLSYRRPFHIADAAYVGPPLLLALVCAAGIVQGTLDVERDARVRPKLRAYSDAAVLLLVVLAFMGRALRYGEDERVPVPGTQGMLSARPEVAMELGRLAGVIREKTGSGDGLAVFPEGEILNGLSGRSNPLRHKLYIPGYLTETNEHDVESDLTRSNPAAVVVWHRSTAEYGPATFGVDYGAKVMKWIEEHYVRQSPGGRALPDPRQRTVLFLRDRTTRR